MTNYTEVFDGALPSHGQMERLLEILSAIANKDGGQIPSQVEYGIRLTLGADGNLASTPTGQRVMRYGGAVTEWNPTFTPNVGDGEGSITINQNDFDLIPIFSPEIVTDAAQNVFARFKPFYYAVQDMGGYRYIWVCETQLYPFYRMPKAFVRNGVVGYRDIGIYEGSFETAEDVEYLCSKSGKNPAHNRTRTQFWNDAQAWQTRLSVDTEREWYGITQISEITEILQPLMTIAFGTLNTQSVFKGATSFNYTYCDTGVAVAAYDESTMTVYSSVTAAANNFPVGGTVNINSNEASEDYYREITASGMVKGSIEGTTFTPSEDGTDYLFVTMAGSTFPATPTTICARPAWTGQTDDIQASNGTPSNDGFHSFKVFGIENIYGNIYKQVLDVSILNYIPMQLKDPYSFTEFSSSTYQQYYNAASYRVGNTNGYASVITSEESMSDVALTTAADGSSTTYYCDYFNAPGSTSNFTVYYGGPLTNGPGAGGWDWALHNGVGYSRWSSGARLSRWVTLQGG